MYIDYYVILEIDPSATRDEIHKAFKKKALQYHPDRNSGFQKEAEEKMKLVNRAHETLYDSEKRRNYDLYEYQQAKHGNHSTYQEEKKEKSHQTSGKDKATDDKTRGKTKNKENTSTHVNFKPLKYLFFSVIAVSLLSWLIVSLESSNTSANSSTNSIYTFIPIGYQMASYQAVYDKKIEPLYTDFNWDGKEDTILVLESSYSSLSNQLLVVVLDKDGEKFKKIAEWKIYLKDDNWLPYSQNVKFGLYDDSISPILKTESWRNYLVLSTGWYLNWDQNSLFLIWLGQEWLQSLSYKKIQSGGTLNLVADEGKSNSYYILKQELSLWICNKYNLQQLTFSESNINVKDLWTTKYFYTIWDITNQDLSKCVWASSNQDLIDLVKWDLWKKYHVITTEYKMLDEYTDTVLNDINLRKYPNSKADILSIISKWSNVKVFGVTNITEENWYRVQDNTSYKYWWVNKIALESPQEETQEDTWNINYPPVDTKNSNTVPVYDKTIKYFDCGEGWYYYDPAKSCICQSGYWQASNWKCIQMDCWTGWYYYDPSKSCICQSGYWKSSNGKCMKVDCGEGWYYYDPAETCICRSGYWKLSDGKCYQ